MTTTAYQILSVQTMSKKYYRTGQLAKIYLQDRKTRSGLVDPKSLDLRSLDLKSLDFESLDLDPTEVIWHPNGNLLHVSYTAKGKMHRDLGPAKVEWFIDGRWTKREYWTDDQLHRADGPAVETRYYNG